MREFVRRQQQATEYNGRFRQQVQIGLDSAAAGDLTTAEEVEAEAESWREAIRQRLA